MMAYKDPGFQERQDRAAAAKKAAIEKLKAKPPVDEAVLAERRAAAEAKEAALAAEREAKKAARLAEKEAAAAAKLAKSQKPVPKIMTEEERKALRDARYAARKGRTQKS